MFSIGQRRGLAVIAAIVALVYAVALGIQASVQAADRTAAKTITLGIVAESNQTEVEEHFRDFVSYIARRLSTRNAVEGKLAIAPTQARLANLLTERKADFYLESPYPTYMINSVYGAGKLLLRRWKGGMAEYRALIFTSKNSETKRLEDLRGKLIAFEDPESTSGYYLPKYFLSKRGLKLSQKSGLDAKVSAGEVGYVFAYGQDKLVDWVLTKQAAAGAFSNDDHAALEVRKKTDLIILAETDSLPRHLVSVRKDLAPAITSALQKILMSMHEDAEGRSILQKADGTTKFDALPGGELAMRQRLLNAFLSSAKK